MIPSDATVSFTSVAYHRGARARSLRCFARGDAPTPADVSLPRRRCRAAVLRGPARARARRDPSRALSYSATLPARGFRGWERGPEGARSDRARALAAAKVRDLHQIEHGCRGRGDIILAFRMVSRRPIPIALARTAPRKSVRGSRRCRFRASGISNASPALTTRLEALSITRREPLL